MIVVCTDCSAALRIQTEDAAAKLLVGDKSDFWPDKYPCYKCGARSVGYLDPEVALEALSAMSIVDLTHEEAYAAMLGLGLPDERTCCEEVLVPLFAASGLKVKGRQIRNTTRYCVDSIEFPDGTKIHLAASPQGATVYRIVAKHSYVNGTEKHAD